jgi:protein SCO1/2
LRTIRYPIAISILLVAAGLGIMMIPRGTPSDAAPAHLQGTLLPNWTAPNFALTDQFGRHITFDQFHGHPVLLTFTDAHCAQLCPVVAETIHRALLEVGPAANRLGVLGVSVNPAQDTLPSMRAFSREHGLLHRWHYLTGKRHQLAPIWHAYHLFVAPPNAPPAVRNAHTSATYLIDGRGRERVLLTGVPDDGQLVRDLRILLGVPVSTPISSAIPAAQPGHPAPTFSLATPGGRYVSLQSLRGHPVLLNFWATWCTACRSEMPRLESWYRKLHGQGITILGVDDAEGTGAVRDFVHRYGVNYPIALDTNGTVSARYGVSFLPVSVLIDAHGSVASVHLGVLGSTYLKRDIMPLLHAPSR